MSYADDRIRHDADRTTDRTLRLTVPEAAGAMGISAEAVRQRIKRGTLTTEKDAGGTVYVLLDADSTRTNGNRTYDITTDSTGLVEELRDRVRSLETQLFEERTANRENRRLLAAALERIPAIEEAPSEPRDATETGSGLHPGVDPQGDDAGPEAGVSRRSSWWRRLFSG